MAYAYINGVKYYYEDEGNGPVLFLIHGLGESAESWLHQRAYFKQAFRVVCPDLRGHHRTEDGDLENITIKQYADDMVALMDHLHIEKAHVLGFSMGGLIVQEMTRHHQHRMKTLIISNATSFYEKEQIDRVFAQRLENFNHLTMDEIAHNIATACLPHDEDTSSPYYKTVKDGVFEEVFTIFRNNRLAPYKKATFATFYCDVRDLLVNINVPTCIISSHFDRATPIPYGQYMHVRIAGAKMQILPTGHLSKIQEPDLYNQVLKEFLMVHEIESVKKLKS